MKSLHFVSVVYLLVQLDPLFAKDGNKMDVCTHPKPHGVAQHFLKKIGEKGFTIPLHMKLDSIANNKKDVPEVDDLPLKNATTGEPLKPKSEKCYELVIKVNYGKLFVPLKCKYYDGMKMRCSARMNMPEIPGDTPVPVPIFPSPAAALPRPDGIFFHSKTDNSTYSVVVGCLAGAQPIWLVLTGAAELKKTAKDDIMNHIVALGFRREDVSSNSDQLNFQRLDKDDCTKDPTNLAGDPLGGFLGGVKLPHKEAGGASSKNGGSDPVA